MKRLDVHCTVIENILQKHVDKELNPKLKEDLKKQFKNNILNIIILEGECKDKISDRWYFLDKNMQSENCNALIRGGK